MLEVLLHQQGVVQQQQWVQQLVLRLEAAVRHFWLHLERWLELFQQRKK